MMKKFYTLFFLAITVGVRLFSGLAAYFLNVVAARNLSLSEYGSFTFLLSMTTLFVLVSRFGLDRSLLKEVAGSRYKKKKVPLGDMGFIFGSSFVFIAMLSLLFVACLYLSADLLVLNFDAILNTKSLLLFSGAILPWSLVYLHADLLRGYGYINAGLLISGISIPLITILQFYFFDVAGLTGLIRAFFLSTVSVLAITFLVISLQFKLGWRHFQLSLKRINFLVCKALPIFSGQFLTNIQLNISLIMLAVFFAAGDVAIYSVGLKTGLLLGIFLLAVNSIYEPKFAALYANGELIKLRKVVKKSVAALCVIALLVGVPLIIAPDFFLSFFGGEYLDANHILIIVAVTQIINLMTGPAYSLLIMTNGQVVARNIALISLTTCVTIALLLIPEYGAIGAAIAHCSGILVKSVFGVFAVKSVLGENLFMLMFGSKGR